MTKLSIAFDRITHAKLTDLSLDYHLATTVRRRCVSCGDEFSTSSDDRDATCTRWSCMIGSVRADRLSRLRVALTEAIGGQDRLDKANATIASFNTVRK